MRVLRGEETKSLYYGNIDFKNEASYLYKLIPNEEGIEIDIYRPLRINKDENKVYFERFVFTTDEPDVLGTLEDMYQLIGIMPISTCQSVESLFNVKKVGEYYEVENAELICERYGLPTNELNNIIEELLLKDTDSSINRVEF